MSGEHARLSPSASERWLACPASIRMEAEVPEQPDSVYAREGTCAHELGEIKVRHAFGHISRAMYDARLLRWRKAWAVDERTEFEMDVHTEAYVELIKERAALYPNTQVMVEQRLDTGVPTCWGTSDVVLASPHHVEIVDLKYGTGVQVEAEGNSQLRLYALGALDAYGDVLGDTEVVRSTVFQPRLDHTLTEELTPKALREWRESILPIAAEALGESARFGPSEAACRWCPASGRCRAQLESIFEDEATDFAASPILLTDAELADVLDRMGAIKDWLQAVEEAALARAYTEGHELPGWKVVLSGGKRSLKDHEAAIEHLVTVVGYEREQVAKETLRGIGELETLMGKVEFASTMAPYIKPPVGKPALVPEADKRPSIQPNSEAAKAFASTATEPEELL